MESCFNMTILSKIGGSHFPWMCNRCTHRHNHTLLSSYYDGAACPSGAPKFTIGFNRDSWCPNLSFLCSACVFISSIFWPFYCLRVITVFKVFRLLTDFVCLYTYEFWLSLCKIVRSSVILLLPLWCILQTSIQGIDFICATISMWMSWNGPLCLSVPKTYFMYLVCVVFIHWSWNIH
jgi:hypothetical protein